MERFTNLELLLGGLLLATAIGLIILWVRNNALRSLVLLKPGEDKLRVDYYWMDIDKLPANEQEIHWDELYKTEGNYIYTVEGKYKLVTKEQSITETLKKRLEMITPTSATNLRALSDAAEDTDKIGGINPPPILRKPPGQATLMAIEISVDGAEGKD